MLGNYTNEELLRIAQHSEDPLVLELRQRLIVELDHAERVAEVVKRHKAITITKESSDVR